MAHTRLHNRKPLAPPTVIISNNYQENNENNKNNNDDLFDDSKEIEKQLQLKEASLKKKEAELASRERALQYQSEDNLRARQFYEQKKALLDNKPRMQRELSGNDMKIALQNQYPRVSKSEDNYYDHQNQNNYDQQARENYFEQLRMARANRERMKHEEIQGSQMKKALMDAQADDDENNNNNYYRRKNKGNDNFDELNAYMRQQRREAAENKRRLEEAMRGSAAKEALSQTDDYTEQKNHQTIKRKNFNEKTGKFEYDYYSDYYYSDYSDPPPQKDDNQARNEYMRQLRHEREANRLRAREYEKRAKEEGNKKQIESSNPQKKQQKDLSDSYILQKEKQVEMSQDERNAYMRDERQRRRENKEKIEAMGQINMDQLIAEAEAEQKAKSRSNRRTRSRRKMKVDNSQNNDKPNNTKSEKQNIMLKIMMLNKITLI